MNEIQKILEEMEPETALSELAQAIKKILSHFNDDTRVRFVTEMISEAGEDKISSLVNL